MHNPTGLYKSTRLKGFIVVTWLFLSLHCPPLSAAPKYVRVNQVGYLSSDTKIAVAFSNDNLDGLTFSVVRISDGGVAFGPQAMGADQGTYCAFSHNYRLNFSSLQASGTYTLRLSDGTTESPTFVVSDDAYSGIPAAMLNFLRAQRCGANPFIPATCHTSGAATNLDAKGVDDGQVYDMSGGWHDAGDYIKFLVTVSNVLDLLLFAYTEDKAKFPDDYLANGAVGNNGIPDILDEAKYGLD
jgi:hypothetical protein